MANTTWSTTDKTASLTLSNSNLTATTAAAFQGARGADKQIAGKFYFELTTTTWGASCIVGLANSAASLTSTTFLNITGVLSSGAIVVNNAFPGPTLGTVANGSVLGIALDLTARLVWFRLGAAGNWNGSGTANPATGISGIDCSSVGGGGIPLYPFLFLNTNPLVVTGNFGDSAFTGTVPSGFTSGFTAGASPPLNALASQISAEHWLTTSPPAQVTQVALEHWATVTGTGLQAIATQIALEHWASVANVPAFVNGPIITMIGSP